MTKKGQPATHLESFLRANGLKPAHVAREAGISRQHLLRIRTGRMAPKVATAVRIRDACRKLIGRYVGIEEVFDLGGGER